MGDTIDTIAQGDAQDRAYQAAIRYASDLGAQHGRNAASWYDIPDADAARIILRGLEDGDPAILDTLPAPDLSGQWADSLTGTMLVHDALDGSGAEDDPAHAEWFDDICDAYERAYSDAAEDEVSRMARFHAE